MSSTLCLRHGKPAQQYRLVYPQPPETPPVMRWHPPGPHLWMCEECRVGSEMWATLVLTRREEER
jgi:hypothetical protein